MSNFLCTYKFFINSFYELTVTVMFFSSVCVRACAGRQVCVCAHRGGVACMHICTHVCFTLRLCLTNLMYSGYVCTTVIMYRNGLPYCMVVNCGPCCPKYFDYSTWRKEVWVLSKLSSVWGSDSVTDHTYFCLFLFCQLQ